MFVYRYEVHSSLGAQAKVERKGNQVSLTIWGASLFSGKEKEKALLGGSECYRQIFHMQVSDFILMKEKFWSFWWATQIITKSKKSTADFSH